MNNSPFTGSHVASDAFLAAIVSSSSDAILTKDLNGTITFWNAGAGRIFGYTPEEVLGRPVTLLFPADRFNEEPEILRRIKAGEVIDHYETVRKCKDGKLIDISLTVSPIRDASGRIIGASKIARDITEQKQVQERLRITLGSIGDAVISLDTRGCVTFINPIAEKLTGWSEDQAIGTSVKEIFHVLNGWDRRPAEAAVLRALRDDLPIKDLTPKILIAKDGIEHPIEDMASPIHGRGGDLIGVVHVFRDVTRQRNAEITANRLKAIVEGSDDAIISKDLQGVIQSWNAGAERLFGYSETEVIGKPISILIPPDRQDEEPEIIARFGRGERVDHFQTIRQRKDGKLIQVSVTISPVRNEHGKIIGASKIARDITMVREAQQKLEEHARDLETKVRERTAKLHETITELESFSYSLSHDMRAPIRAIQSYTELVLAEQGDKLGDSRQYLHKVVGAAARMDRLIQDVLSFARLSQIEIQITPLEVDKLVRDILAERPELQEPKARITLDGPLYPMHGHDASLTQCITNILDNAVKFVPPGTKPDVKIFSEIRDRNVRLCIRDNGIGIEPQARNRIFGIFERLHTTGSYKGTGVGLAIVRRATERMKGTVGVESLPGKGSTFWIELPSA